MHCRLVPFMALFVVAITVCRHGTLICGCTESEKLVVQTHDARRELHGAGSATTRELTKLDGKAQSPFLLCLEPGMRATLMPYVRRQGIGCLYCQKYERCHETPISLRWLLEIIR
jgi:hypothetical protein